MGILIPPSIAMILYGVIAEQSISKLFVAGVVPGIVLAVLMALYTTVVVRGTQAPKRYSLREKLDATYQAGWVLALPVLILVSIYPGFATPTEAAAAAVVYVAVLGLMSGALVRISHTPCGLRRLAASRIPVRDAKSVWSHTVERHVPAGDRRKATLRAG